MSTRATLYARAVSRAPGAPAAEQGMHVYRELHDGCIHCSIYRGPSELNLILAPEHWAILQALLIPEGSP